MLETTNYKLKKIELKDSPPDITSINPNWDLIDQMLKTLHDSTNTWDSFKASGGKLFDSLDITPESVSMDTIKTSKDSLALRTATKALYLSGNYFRPSSDGSIGLGNSSVSFSDLYLTGIGSIKEAVIVESSGNANGNYVKFADGTMVCYLQGPSLTTSEKFGVGYKSPPWTWTFPAAYTSVPKVLSMAANHTLVSGGGTSLYACIFSLFSLDSAGRVGNPYVFAIGRWK